MRFALLELAQVRARAHAAGGKVNDVVLDLAGGLRELLLGRGEPVVALKLIASAPVPVSDFGSRGHLNAS